MENTHDLTNEELMYIYYQNKTLNDRFEKAFSDKGLNSVMPTPWGIMMNFRPLTVDDIASIKKEPDYIISKKVVEKLHVIAEFIESSGEDFSHVKNIYKRKEDFLSGEGE